MFTEHQILQLHRSRVAAGERRARHQHQMGRHRSSRPPDPSGLRRAAGRALVRLGHRVAGQPGIGAGA